MTEALNPSKVWSKLHVQLSAGQIRRDMAALLPPTGHEGDSAEGAYIVVRLLERTHRAPPLQESMWELPPLGSHGHPPPASQRRALRWPPPPTGAAAAPATSADRPHRSGRALRRPNRYAGEEEIEMAEPGEEEVEEEEGSLAAHAPAAVPVVVAALGASSGGPASQAAAPLGGQHRLPSRQAESHAVMAVQDLHDMEEAAAPPPLPVPGRGPLMVCDNGGGSPYAHVALQQAPPWLASQQAGLAHSAALQPAGFTAWAGGSARSDGRLERQQLATTATAPPPPHPTTPPAAAGGAALPFMQQAQQKLAGPAARALCPAQCGDAARQELEHWMEVAAAHLPIPPQGVQREAAADDMEYEDGAADGAQQAASMQDVHALLRAMLTPTPQQPAH